MDKDAVEWDESARENELDRKRRLIEEELAREGPRRSPDEVQAIRDEALSGFEDIIEEGKETDRLLIEEMKEDAEGIVHWEMPLRAALDKVGDLTPPEIINACVRIAKGAERAELPPERTEGLAKGQRLRLWRYKKKLFTLTIPRERIRKNKKTGREEIVQIPALISPEAVSGLRSARIFMEERNGVWIVSLGTSTPGVSPRMAEAAATGELIRMAMGMGMEDV